MNKVTKYTIREKLIAPETCKNLMRNTRQHSVLRMRNFRRVEKSKYLLPSAHLYKGECVIQGEENTKAKGSEFHAAE